MSTHFSVMEVLLPISSNHLFIGLHKKYSVFKLYVIECSFQAKHTFFKNCIRTSKNFINVTKTCSSRHQLAQVSYMYNGLFPKKLKLPPSSPSKKEALLVTSDLSLTAFLSDFDEAIVPHHVEIYGTLYEAGMILILSKAIVGQSLTVGLLKYIAVVNGDVVFGCQSFKAEQSSFGYYVTTKSLNNLVSIKQADLVDVVPLVRIGPPSAFYFCLHHYVSVRN